MIVYRFERNGIGPYVSRTQPANGSFYRKQGKTRTEKKYGALFQERLRQIDSIKRTNNYQRAHQSKEYMYGCKSKEDLRLYFGGDFKSLFSQGFRIKRYRVPDDEIIDIEIEVAFPVKYHKLQKLSKVQKVI